MRRSATILMIQAPESTIELNCLHYAALPRFEIGYNKLEPIRHRQSITVTLTVTETRHIGSPKLEVAGDQTQDYHRHYFFAVLYHILS